MWQTSRWGTDDGRDFVMHSRIGVLHALNRNVKGLFNSGHKDTLGKARKKKPCKEYPRAGLKPKGS